MQKAMVGAWKSAAAMPGAEFTAPIMTRTAGAENFASQAYGARRQTRLIMAGKSGGLSTTAHPEKTIRPWPEI